MRMQAEGKSLREIREQIDRTYSKYGPGTPTPMPPASRRTRGVGRVAERTARRRRELTEY